MQLVGGNVARQQLEHLIAAIRSTLADQQAEIALLPGEQDIGGQPQIGHRQLEALGVIHLHRLAQGEHVVEAQRIAHRGIAQQFRSGLNMQRLSLEGDGTSAGYDSAHAASVGVAAGTAAQWPARGQSAVPAVRRSRMPATVVTFCRKCSGLMVPMMALLTAGWLNTSSKPAVSGSSPSRQMCPLASAFFTRMPLPWSAA